MGTIIAIEHVMECIQTSNQSAKDEEPKQAVNKGGGALDTSFGC
jgi:hypothetical protein